MRSAHSYVNAKRVCAAAAVLTIGLTGTAAHAGSITFSADNLLLAPGQSFSTLGLLSNLSVPLLGYSLDIFVQPVGSATGSISANAAMSNFFDSQNLITAGGKTRSGLFSVINTAPSGGLFVSTSTSDFSTVVSVGGVNDVLAQLFFDVPLNASGEFLIGFGPGTALSDGAGSPVDFAAGSLRVVVTGGPDGPVIPLPSSVGLAAAALAGVGGIVSTRRRRPQTD